MSLPASNYRGRFAPSPTGLLHAGSMVAALASWLDARAHRGCWLVRMEDVDVPRCTPAAAQGILRQLADCGLLSDEPVLAQSTRTEAYEAALHTLIAAGRAYPCGCSRRDIELALGPAARERHGELVYPGICRSGLHGKPARAWRFRLPAAAEVTWTDRRLGEQHQDVAQEVGDFVLRRADGLFAYQLAVVVDDAAQGITQVVRGEDLASNTARQILLAQALGQRPPAYLHTPIVLANDGQKLSKQNGAQAVDTGSPRAALATLAEAASRLGLPEPQASLAASLERWVAAWPSPRTEA